MLYKKPKDVRFVDMAIYIDNNIYQETHDDDLIYQYMYHLIYMFAKKSKWFRYEKDYDDFAIYGATRVYMQMLNPKRMNLLPNGLTEKPKIKSVLNYIKCTLYPMKVDYQQKFYAQTISQENDEQVENYHYSFSSQMRDSIEQISLVEFNCCLHDIKNTIYNFMIHIPYKQNTAEWYNIYMSCLLTILNEITPTIREQKRIKSLKLLQDKVDQAVDDSYLSLQKDDAILFHCDESLRPYIKVLSREIKHFIAKDLSELLNSYLPTESCMELLYTNNLED